MKAQTPGAVPSDNGESEERRPGDPGRQQDASINVCFSTTQGLLSRWIRWVTRSPVSHAILTFHSQTLDKILVMEATGRGFNVIPWKKWKNENTLVARFKIAVPEATELEALRRIATRLGSEYDTISLFGFFLRRWKKRGSNPLDDPTKLICSEAVAYFLSYAGFEEFASAGEWTPADIFLRAIESPDRFIKEETGSDFSTIEARISGEYRK
jgi:hypothetical protein